MPVRFIGETHGCYSDALQMCIGAGEPGEDALEVLTGSPFGMAVYKDGRPYFAPARWSPEIGLRHAMNLLGWACDRTGGDAGLAVDAMRKASPEAPLLAGPFEMGLLPHHVGLGQPIGADHFLTVLGMEGDMVVMHDPRAHPYALVPLDGLLNAWETDTLSYSVEPYSFRSAFRRNREVDLDTALHELLPIAADLVDDAEAAAEAAESAAEVLDSGLETFQYFHLADFMVCVGSRRRVAAAALLARIGRTGVATVLDHQARLIGSMQTPLVTGDYPAAAVVMRRLAPTFADLRRELRKALS